MNFSLSATRATATAPRAMAARPMAMSARIASRRVAAPRFARLATRAVETSKVLADVRNIIAEQLGKDLDEVTADAKFSDLGADSLDTVEIMMALEEKFSITLEEEGAEKIATVQDAAELIAGQIDN